MLTQALGDDPAVAHEVVLTAADHDDGLGDLLTLRGRVRPFVVQERVAKLLRQARDVRRRLDLVFARRVVLVDATGDRLHLADELRQLGARLLLLREVALHLAPPSHIALDALADELDEHEHIVERLLDLGPFLLLLAFGIDRVERVAGPAGGPAPVGRLLRLHVEHVFTRPDAEGLTHDVDDGEPIQRGCPHAIDGIDQGWALELEHFLEGLEERVALRVEPAGVLESA